ncbi:hypothetical protein [Streptomyces griseus]|uniref:hypothetical protein n=1 Tax=Streptomyces griseus TaxID=1911 RepID=UPI00056A5504|nr:hypothetical protein [Streptomyces griseus]
MLISLAVRFAGKAPGLGSALAISTLGATGPAMVGTSVAALSLIPTLIIARTRHRRSAASVRG